MNYPSRLFPSGKLDWDGDWPIPSKESANAVDFIYPGKSRLRKLLVRLITEGDSVLDDKAILALTNIVYALIDNNSSVRERVNQALNDKAVSTCEDNRDQATTRFVESPGFRRILAKAVCGVNDQRHTDDLANLAIVLCTKSPLIEATLYPQK